jgi:hypothetical protein
VDKETIRDAKRTSEYREETVVVEPTSRPAEYKEYKKS